jgi:hypothetical protein
MNELNYERQVETLASNAAQSALPVYQSLIEQLSNALKGARNFDDAKQKIEALPRDDQFLKYFSNHLLLAIESAEALGRSLIIKKNESLGGAIVASKSIKPEWFACDEPGVQVSFNIIPEIALQALRQQSMEIAGVENDYLKKAILDKLDEAMRGELTYNDWKQQIDSMFDSYGVTRISANHAQLVFRMNVTRAYTLGMDQQAAEMHEAFPLAFYSAIHDSRSRHLPLEGFYPADKVPLPPVDYNCRCSVRYIHASQVTGNEKVYEEPPRPDLIKLDQRGEA